MNQGVLDQIPRSALTLLLAAQAAAIAPHVPRLSPWILLVWVVCAFWRVMVLQGRWGYPGTAVKAALVVLGAVGVGASYGQLYGLDPTSALLIIAFSLKMLEANNRRDALVVIYLGYFVIAVQFLYEQTMGLTGYQLFAAMVMTAALVGLNQSWSRPSIRASLKTSGKLLLQAVPLALVMFLFFPRIAPLWSVPLPDASARMGLSDSMSPTDVARLGRSEELAFRVEFPDGSPPASELYWRALTFSHYEDGTWSGGRLGRVPERLVQWYGMTREPGWLAAVERQGEPLRYSVLTEPTHNQWLFALDIATPLSAGTGIGRDYRLLSSEPVISRMRYEVESHLGARTDLVLPDWLRQRELALPVQGNPRTRALVRSLVQEHGTGMPFVIAVFNMFRNQEYHYTLNPPTIDQERIDGFLFDTMRGFCGHYAGAFVYMMRLAGMPARVVAGYQGGERNPLGDHLIVRQSDAHAWAEVWIEGQGWVRVDPTAAVSPERIDQGAEAALHEQSAAEGISPFVGGLRSVVWLMDAIYFIDSLEHRWNVMVVSYDTDQQNELLESLLGEVTPTRIAIASAMAAGIAIAISSLGFVLGAMRNRRPRLLRIHDQWSDVFASAGHPRHPFESPAAYGARLAHAYPALASEIQRVAAGLQAQLYVPEPDPEAVETLSRSLRELRFALALARLRATFSRRQPPREDGGAQGSAA